MKLNLVRSFYFKMHFGIPLSLIFKCKNLWILKHLLLHWIKKIKSGMVINYISKLKDKIKYVFRFFDVSLDF